MKRVFLLVDSNHFSQFYRLIVYRCNSILRFYSFYFNERFCGTWWTRTTPVKTKFTVSLPYPNDFQFPNFIINKNPTTFSDFLLGCGVFKLLISYTFMRRNCTYHNHSEDSLYNRPSLLSVR